MSLGEAIRKRRKSLGLTLQVLAEKIASDPGNLSRIERGAQNVSEAQLLKICEVLNCAPSSLFQNKTSPNPIQKLDSQTFARWFRLAAPYINTFSNKTFVIAFGGELLDEDQFTALSHDINLLTCLNVKIVLVHGADLPIKNFKELIAYAKANPGKLNYASSGNGSLQHVTGAMLEQQAGIKMTHIPYKGTGPALQDLLAGQVDITFGTAPPFMQHVASGRLRVLAVTGKTRLPSLPDVPTTAEVGYPKVDATSWFGVFAPAGVPKPIIDKLSAEIAKVVQSPAFRQRAIDLGASADYENPKQFTDHVANELVSWANVVKAAKIEAE